MLLAVYVAAKSIDTLVWLNITSSSEGFAPWQFYSTSHSALRFFSWRSCVLGLMPAIFIDISQNGKSSRIGC